MARALLFCFTRLGGDYGHSRLSRKPETSDRQAYRAKAARNIRQAVSSHLTGLGKCIDGKPWGGSWQSAMWTSTLNTFQPNRTRRTAQSWMAARFASGSRPPIFKTFKKGDPVAHRVVVFFLELTPKKTATLAQSLKIEENQSVLHLKLPEGGEAKILIN